MAEKNEPQRKDDIELTTRPISCSVGKTPEDISIYTKKSIKPSKEFEFRISYLIKF